MQLSLKRALKLRKELEAAVTKIELPTTASVSLLVEANVKDPTPVLRAGADAMMAKVDAYIAASRILADIRVKIAKANVANGVEHVLAQAAHQTRVMTIYKKLAGSAVLPAAEHVQAEVNFSYQSLQNPERAGYGGASRSVQLSVVPQELHDKAVEAASQLKRSLMNIEDERTSKNAAVQIEIADEDAKLLQQLGML